MGCNRSKVWALAAAALVLGTEARTTAQEAKAGSDGGLVAHWRFDAGVGEVAKDSSGRGHDGVIHNGRWVKGAFGTALHFNGESTHVVLPHLPELDGSDEMTVEAWVFWEGTGRYPNILTGGAWNPGGFLLFVADHSCMFRLGKPGPEAWDAGRNWQEVGAGLVRNLELGRWYCLAATFKRPHTATYVDGRPCGAASWNFPVGQTGAMDLGKWGLDQGKTQSHHGLIDEVRIHNRALSAAEITAAFEREADRRR